MKPNKYFFYCVCFQIWYRAFFIVVCCSAQFLLSACASHSSLLVPHIEDYVAMNEADIRAMYKRITASEKRTCSVASSVTVSNALSSKRFEQVLLSDLGRYRVTWFAPNYIQTLGYYVESFEKNKEAKLYCDLTLQECWNAFPDSADLDGLREVVQLEGVDLKKILLGIPPDVRQYPRTNFLYRKDNANDVLVLAENVEYSVSMHNIDSGKNILLEKLFVERSGQRIAEVRWEYGGDDIPTKLTLDLLTRNITLELQLKKYNLTPDFNTGDIFSSTPPSGFLLR